MAKAKHTKAYSSLVLGIAVLVGVFVLLPESGSFAESIEIMRGANWAYVFCAIVLIFLTFPTAAFTLLCLSLKPLRFFRTFQIQLASGFAGKLAPAGIGGFALNTRYLTKQKHSVVEASAVMAVNGSLGFMGHILIIVAAFTFGSQTLSDTISVSLPVTTWLLIVLGVACLLLLLVVIGPIRRRLQKIAKDMRTVSKYYQKRPLALIKAFVGASLVTLLFASALNLCAYALGFDLTPLQVLLVYTAGTIGIALTPTPGGLGGAEAALTAALVAVGLETSQALSVALLYRLLSYWLPILPGLITFQYCLKRKYI